MRKYDLVVFGATGCTGKYVVLNLHNYIKNKNLNLKWAIAGRSKQKLEKVKRLCQEKEGDDFSYLDIIIAEMSDLKSIHAMASLAKILINCSGPFKIFGEPVILKCLETGTHYVDVSNEHQNMEEIYLKYHHAAKEKNVYIVLSCAFDSAVIDLGIIHLENQFDGILNSVETYLELDIVKSIKRGSLMTPAVAESFTSSLSTKSINYQNLYQPFPILEPQLRPRRFIHKSRDVEGKWFLHFNSLNKPVLLRSQRYFYENEDRRPIQIENYLRTKKFWKLIGITFFVGIVYIFSQFFFTRNWLKKVLGNDTNDKWMDNPDEYLEFSLTFVGKGWSKNKKDTDTPSKKVVTRISAKDHTFLYGITADICIFSALTILKEQSKMPHRGGVYTTASAFSRTKILEKLKGGMKYETLSSV